MHWRSIDLVFEMVEDHAWWWKMAEKMNLMDMRS